MAIKTVDTIRRIRDDYHEQTKNMTPSQRRDFFKKQAALATERARPLSKKSSS